MNVRKERSPDDHPTFLSLFRLSLRTSVTPSHVPNPSTERNEDQHTRCNTDETESQLLTLEHLFDTVHCESDIDFDFLNLYEESTDQGSTDC